MYSVISFLSTTIFSLDASKFRTLLYSWNSEGYEFSKSKQELKFLIFTPISSTLSFIFLLDVSIELKLH